MSLNHIKEIVKRDGRILPYDRGKVEAAIYRAAYAEGGHDRTRAAYLAEHVELTLNRNFTLNQRPTVEDVQDAVEKTLIEHGHARTAKTFILYRNERARMRKAPELHTRVPEAIPYPKIWQRLAWNVRHGIPTIKDLNKKIENGDFNDLIIESDAAYGEDVALATRRIIDRKDEIRLVIIAGPSSSGKTTTTRKIAHRMAEEGLEFVALELDNYFYDLDVHPTDDRGDHDFETPAAIDIPLVNKHLADLLKGETIEMPIFDFKSGKRLKRTTPLKLSKGQILLIDSLHGLSPELTASVPGESKLKVYIETLCQLLDSQKEFVRWTDVRLLRRMIRDKQHRNHSLKQTLEHWHYVRKAEIRYIFPFVQEADVYVNGSMAYDLPVLKKYIYPFLERYLEDFIDYEGYEDAPLRAKRVYRILREVLEIDDDSIISPNSVLREFIGGSAYFS